MNHVATIALLGLWQKHFPSTSRHTGPFHLHPLIVQFEDFAGRQQLRDYTVPYSFSIENPSFLLFLNQLMYSNGGPALRSSTC